MIVLWLTIATCLDTGAGRSDLVHNQVAKQPEKGAELRARDAWRFTDPKCRDAAWYLLAANILRAPGHSKEPLVVDKIRFETAKEALEAGLAAEPFPDEDLLAYVAYLARIAPGVGPPLPKDACDRSMSSLGGDRSAHAYVCTVRALLDGRRADAAKAVDGIASPRFPDVAELRALAGAPAKKLEPRKLGCDPFCPAEGWRVKK